jgi:endonuclease-3
MQSQKQHIKKIISILEKEYPNPKTALYFKTAHQLLIATILSAQATDKRVNIVTEDLFKKYKSIKSFADADWKTLDQDIHSINFHGNKAKNIIASSKIITEKFHGKVPDTMEDLITLSGVARKTANVVLADAFHKEEGIAVDTHVIRVSNRLGLTKNIDPKKIETDLMENTPKENWSKLSHLLIFHGRNTCIARKPKCELCKLNRICPSAFKFGK